MKGLVRDKFLFVFVPVVLMVLYANIVDSLVLDIAFKPLIVVSLLIYLFVNGGHKKMASFCAIGGLLFSLMGDVLLVFQKQHELFFVSGLVAFLVAHLLYITYYIRSASQNAEKKLKNKYLFFILMLIYGAIFYSQLYGNLGGLKVPVLVYTSVLIGMNIFALNRYGKVNTKSFRLIMAGALFFTLSDSLLALNKFLIPIPLAGVWILASYAAAQYLITEGVLNSSPDRVTVNLN